ncbi:beta-phosphoglucomutase family hydrolase [Mobilicoccus sp.]|uniref:HAD family hydrolase n=1 Tax=Mobilicoccus sp. TaxID=2034349 RepID=UPI002897A864|nr:beta-phosphoglucomutase family hydrolase [Mobilicoccus sp.]
MDWTQYDAALFDLDGVLTPTATVHMAAWEEMFTAFLATRGAAAYTSQDYFDHVDGKPRYDGVRDLLASRGLTLPEGTPEDPSDADTVCGLGNRKNDAFNAVLDRDGVEPYPGSLALIEALAERGVRMAVVSSSKNAPAVLAAAGIDRFFPVVVDGRVATQEGLPGKPAPDTFLAAAERVGASRERAVVLEDATSGVAAGRAGDFGLVVGVDRGAGVDALTAAGADVVVGDLQDLLP